MTPITQSETAPTPTPQRDSHFVPWDQPGKRLARAYCGKLVDRDREHALEPTCERCAELQAIHDRTVI